MQKLTWFIISLFFLNHYCHSAPPFTQQPLLVITIMVKNEAEVMEATLKPFLEAGLQYYVVLDTGSTDNTVQVVQKLFKKYKIQHGHIIEQPFVNFAVSRNYALESAEKIFPNAIFFLMIDAEWYVHNVEGLIEFCKKYQNHKAKTYLIKRFFPIFNAQDYVNWLFKAHRNVRFYGAVHEYLNQGTDIKISEDIFISVDPSRTGYEKSARRWLRDINILLKEHEKNPNHLRTIFLLGQTYSCLQKYDEALFWYKKRCNNQKNNEENYQTHYRIGLIYEKFDNWPEALFFYFKAYLIRPQRIDPLIHIAQHYLNIQNYYAAFLLANYIATMPISSEEKLLIVPELYELTRYIILSTAAWPVGEYEIGRHATLKALDHDASNSGLHANLAMYEQALNHKDCNLLHRNYWCQWCNGNLWLNRPAWFNVYSLAHGCYRSKRCNLANEVSWRYWVGPLIIPSSKD